MKSMNSYPSKDLLHSTIKYFTWKILVILYHKNAKKLQKFKNLKEISFQYNSSLKHFFPLPFTFFIWIHLARKSKKNMHYVWFRSCSVSYLNKWCLGKGLYSDKKLICLAVFSFSQFKSPHITMFETKNTTISKNLNQHIKKSRVSNALHILCSNLVQQRSFYQNANQSIVCFYGFTIL